MLWERVQCVRHVRCCSERSDGASSAAHRALAHHRTAPLPDASILLSSSGKKIMTRTREFKHLVNQFVYQNKTYVK